MRAIVQAGLLSLFSIGLFGGEAAAMRIVSQPPCGTPTTDCGLFVPTSTFPLTLGSISFNATQPGRALVTFHGEAYCVTSSDDARALDLVSQITTGATATPTANGPGGSRHAMVLLPEAHEHGAHRTGDSINFTSTRLVTIPAAGPVNLSFRIQKIRMDANIGCRFFSNFVVIVTP
jgi:hypothetical protein